MKDQTLTTGAGNPTPNSANTLGFYAAVLTAAMTLITFVIAYLTPPLSGPFCKGSCYVYPFADIASRFPRDYLWMYPAILLWVIYMILMVCVHHYAAKEKKVYSQIGLYFALMAAAILITDYFVQLSVIQPSLINGETDGVAILTQFNSHGIFIALEDLGYLLMSFAFLFMAPVFSGSKLEKSIRRVFITSFVLTMTSFAIFSIQYGVRREYRFEIASISINWIALIVSGILLGVLFKRAASTPSKT